MPWIDLPGRKLVRVVGWGWGWGWYFLSTVAQTVVPVLVAAVLIVLAINTGLTVFTLILSSAAILAGAFAPTMLVVVLNWETNINALKTCMVAGALTSIAWRMLGWSDLLLETFPGLVFGLIVHRVVMSTLSKKLNGQVGEQITAGQETESDHLR